MKMLNPQQKRLRKLEDVQWSQIVPIVDLGSDFPPEQIAIFRRYRHYRQFYLPPWAATAGDHHYVADFLRPVTIHKKAFARAEVLARLTYKGWLLFHSCVVRFLARGDGRNDPEPEATT